MEDYAVYLRLAVALAVGFVIGLQREQSAGVAPDGGQTSLGGIRTYPLAALLGAIAMLLVPALGAWSVGAGLVVLLIPLTLAYATDLREGRDRGITSELSFVLTYFLGVLCALDALPGSTTSPLLLVAALAVAVTALLSSKEPLHTLAARVSKEDIYATLKFAVLAIVILPLLPDRSFGPYGVLNPRGIGLMAALIAGTSFLGYVAIRILGPGRGLGLTGFFGGLASSTAVTLAFSGRARKEPEVAGACALGIVLASTIMAFRIIATAAVVNPGIVGELSIPVGAMALGGIVAAGVLYASSRQVEAKSKGVALTNPFELGTALKFALLFAVVLVVSKGAREVLGSGGSYLAGLLAGSTDVDAITLSMANLSRSGAVPVREAVVTILLAAASNTVVKTGIAIALGGWSFGRRVLAASAVMLAAGGAGLALLALLR